MKAKILLGKWDLWTCYEVIEKELVVRKKLQVHTGKEVSDRARFQIRCL